MCDVLIRGAGIAGASAALALAQPRAGHVAPRVLLVAQAEWDAPGAGPRALLGSAALGASGPRASIARAAIDELESFVRAGADDCGFARTPAGDGVIDAERLLAALHHAVVDRGVRVIADLRDTASPPLRTVIASEAALPEHDAFCAEAAATTGVQGLRGRVHRASATSAIEPRAVSIAGGHAWLAVDRSGGAFVREGREPAGRSDPFCRVPDAAVQARLEKAARGALSAGERLEVVGPLVRPEIVTCDRAPLVGPHPLRDATLLSIGFSADGVLFAFAAGRAIADWILEGRPRRPEWEACSPRRLL